MLVKELGEFGLIDRIAAMLPQRPRGVIEGIGDDVAVLDTSGPEYLLATCDTQVEGVHFTREAITAFQLGRKVAAINLSDIAAVGGEPCWGLVSLCIPGQMEVGYIEEFYLGLREEMSLAGASIVGGNLSRMESLVVVDLTLLGQVEPRRLVRRSTARLGDAVVLTGSTGESRAGLELIRRPEAALVCPGGQKLIERHLTPRPRLAQGRLLGGSGLVSSMIDVSDGLIADLSHICKASGKGAQIEVESLPVSPELSEAALAAGADPLQWALAGGEDYELLFTCAEKNFPEIERMLSEQTGTSCAKIGIITAGTGVSLRNAAGARVVAGAKGWDHFGG